MFSYALKTRKSADCRLDYVVNEIQCTYFNSNQWSTHSVVKEMINYHGNLKNGHFGVILLYHQIDNRADN